MPARAETAEGLTARLEEAIRRVDAAKEGGAPLGGPDALFPQSEEVTRGGETVWVDHASLRGEWHAVPESGEARRQALDRLRHRLAAVRAELGSGAQRAAPGAPPAPQWREKLTQVLSRPEFKKEKVQEDLRERFWKWLQEKLGFLIPSGTGRVMGRVLGWILYALAGAAVLFVLVVLVRVALPLFRRDRRAAPPAQAGRPAKPDTPESLLALAEARSRAGDWRAALQAMFRWMLLRLHLAGRLDYDPALTNREHLARLKADTTARVAFADLSSQFEMAWYALRPVSSLDFATFRNRCQNLVGGQA